MRKNILCLGLCVAILALANTASARRARVFDDTKTTFGWKIYSDKQAETKLEVVPGYKKARAIQMGYKFNDSAWIALVKEKSVALEKNEGIEWAYNGSGAVVNLRLKLQDMKGVVFGYTVPTGTEVKDWKKIVIPRSKFVYLWGGEGAGSMNWNSIKKMEITLDVDKIQDAKYVLTKHKPGTLAISKIRIVKVSSYVSSPISLGEKKKTSGKKVKGGYLIDSLTSTKEWSSASDQDGKCQLSSSRVVVGKKTIKSLKAEYDFGKKGAWNAIIKSTNFNLSKMKFIRFWYKGKGGEHKLVFKIVDKEGKIFGYTIETATNINKWQSVIAAKEDMQYLYGGAGPGELDLANIKKIEFTIEKKDQKSTKGIIHFRWLMYKT
jgi:hypothetical protein